MKIVRVYFRDAKLRRAWIFLLFFSIFYIFYFFFFTREQFIVEVNEKHRMKIRFENPSIPA